MTAAADAIPHTLLRVQAAGHAVFTQGDLNLNIVGVRSPSRVAGAFDDRLYVVYRENDQWVERSWPITTDPGVYWLQHPMRPEGAAILAAGQYRGAYVVGKHKGYPALVQNRPVMVHRDGNRDGTLDLVPPQPAVSAGINIHAADSNPFDHRDPVRESIGRWSAGCQVFASSADYREWWELVTRAAAVWGPRFTYTLLEV